MRISDWSSDVCSSDLRRMANCARVGCRFQASDDGVDHRAGLARVAHGHRVEPQRLGGIVIAAGKDRIADEEHGIERYAAGALQFRSEEHTSELQSLMRISYAVFCLKKKKQQTDKYQQK